MTLTPPPTRFQSQDPRAAIKRSETRQGYNDAKKGTPSEIVRSVGQESGSTVQVVSLYSTPPGNVVQSEIPLILVLVVSCHVLIDKLIP